MYFKMFFFDVRINTRMTRALNSEPDLKGMSGVRCSFGIKTYDGLTIFGDISIKVTDDKFET